MYTLLPLRVAVAGVSQSAVGQEAGSANRERQKKILHTVSYCNMQTLNKTLVDALYNPRNVYQLNVKLNKSRIQRHSKEIRLQSDFCV